MKEYYVSFRKGLFRSSKVIYLMIAVGPAVYSGIPRTTSKGDGQIPSDARQTNKDKIN